MSAITSTGRRTSLRRGRGTRYPAYCLDSSEEEADEEEDGEELEVAAAVFRGAPRRKKADKAPTVKQQLQAKVSGSLLNRGVSTADRWQAKPKGQLSAEEQKRLDRQRANKRRWAQKERERRKKEMENLQAINADLEAKRHTLENEVNELRKLKYKLKTDLSDHECKILCSNARFTRPAPVSRPHTRNNKVTVGGQTNCAAVSELLGVTTEKIPADPTSAKGTRASRTKTSGWKPFENACSSKENRDMTSVTEKSSPSCSPWNIDAILKAASKVSLTIPLSPQHKVASTEQNEISCAKELQVTDDDQVQSQNEINCTKELQDTDDDQVHSHNQVSESPAQDHFLENVGGFAGHTLQSEGFSTTDEKVFHGSFLKMLQEEQEEELSFIQSTSVIPMDTECSWTDTEKDLPLENSVLVHDVMEGELPSSISEERSSELLICNIIDVSKVVNRELCTSCQRTTSCEHTEGFTCTKTSHTVTGPGRNTDISTTGLTTNDKPLNTGRTSKLISRHSEHRGTALTLLPFSSIKQTSATLAGQSSESIRWYGSKTVMNGVNRPASSTSQGGSLSACGPIIKSAIPRPISFLSNQRTNQRNHNPETPRKLTLPQKGITVELPINVTIQSHHYETINSTEEQFKRSTSWDDNSEKIEKSMKRTRSLSLSSCLSGNTFHEIHIRGQDVQDMSENDDHTIHTCRVNGQATSSSSQIMKDDAQHQRMTDTSSSPSEESPGDCSHGGGRKFILIDDQEIPVLPSTISSQDIASNFLAGEAAESGSDEAPGDRSVVFMGPTEEDGLQEGILFSMPVIPEEDVEFVLQILEQT